MTLLFRLARMLVPLATAAAFVVVFVLFAIWLWWRAEPDDDQRSRGVNALWAAHTWAGDPHSDAEYRAFADLLRDHEISDVFVHAGPLERDGRVPGGRVAHAQAFTEAMRRHAPEIRVQAYLGQIEERGGGPLDLDDPAVRDGIVWTAGEMLALGFEGIHYDIEPIYPGDESFIELLDRTRALTGARGAVLSVALEQLEFVPSARRAIRLLLPGYHDPTEDFLRDVARHVDQVAIMTYDSGLPAASLFGAHMAWQTERVIDAVGDDVTVFMGVPTYDGGSRRFNARAENIRTGVRGVRKGLGRLDDGRTRNVGIAIFAEWTTTPDEWEGFARDWLAR